MMRTSMISIFLDMCFSRRLVNVNMCQIRWGRRIFGKRTIRRNVKMGRSSYAAHVNDSGTAGPLFRQVGLNLAIPYSATTCALQSEATSRVIRFFWGRGRNQRGSLGKPAWLTLDWRILAKRNIVLLSSPELRVFVAFCCPYSAGTGLMSPCRIGC